MQNSEGGGGTLAMLSQGTGGVVLHQIQQNIMTTYETQEDQSNSDAKHDESQNIAVDENPDADDLVDKYKKAIYRHPLFPLLGLLFEKCEQAQTPDCPNNYSFDADIKAFVQHQEKENKAFFVNDPDIDIMMVRAIQVLRIHLLELEKVSELCKDFCGRYITCLKSKLHSQNLLRGIDFSGTEDDEDFQSVPETPPIPQTPETPVSQPQTNLDQGQIVSGGTVYQMVQTPQGLVAQPIQVPNGVGQQTAVQQPTVNSLVPGSTPLSQIGVSTKPAEINPQGVQSPVLRSPTRMDDDKTSKGRTKRGILPKQATQVMKSWLFQHIVHPYPTEDEKKQLSSQTGLSLLQINNWFINARRRILQPMLDASNPELSKAKKTKPPQNRPIQRFWPESMANFQSRAPQESEGEEEHLEHEEDRRQYDINTSGSDVHTSDTHPSTTETSAVSDMVKNVQKQAAAFIVQNGDQGNNTTRPQQMTVDNTAPPDCDS